MKDLKVTEVITLSSADMEVFVEALESNDKPACERFIQAAKFYKEPVDTDEVE